MPDWRAVAASLAETLGARVAAEPAARVHGGCINESLRWESSRGPCFVKIAPATQLAALEAEAEGLAELAGAEAVRVPGVLGCGTTSTMAFLVLEWIELASSTSDAEARLGQQLATQHRVMAAQFGFRRDNTIGSTAQHNGTSCDWVEFFRERRLRAQLDLARRNGYRGALQERGLLLLELMGAYFASYRPVPSLLHGDLWGGNWGVDAMGAPVIFDPAVYYGDREADLAMTRLFGGFGSAFYTAYQRHWPVDQAADSRRGLYNLYHVLNHANLFGGAYAGQALSMIDRLLAELGH
jgi:fructosamine-3-kinase